MARKLFAKKLKHGESRARRGAVGDCSRTFGACATQPIDSRFLLLYNSSFPDPQPALPQNYSLDRYFYRSSATRASPLETPPIFVSQKSNHSFHKKKITNQSLENLLESQTSYLFQKFQKRRILKSIEKEWQSTFISSFYRTP